MEKETVWEDKDLLSVKKLESGMNTKWAGKKILYFEEVDSTNIQAKTAAEKGAEHGTLVTAETQSMGKGRRGRSWSSPRGTGIWMSLVMRPKIHPSAASMLTLTAAMAAVDGIEKTAGIRAGIKWPNDIVSGGKKICGILTEMSTEKEEISYVITGIGINVHTENFPEDIRGVASSVYLESGKRIERSRLIQEILRAFEFYYEKFMETQDMSGLLEAYNERLVNRNNRVKVLKPDGSYTGTALGINEMGELLVKTDDGAVHPVISGEVSVRGVYGYV